MIVSFNLEIRRKNQIITKTITFLEPRFIKNNKNVSYRKT
jgi:hypothetical protein